VGFTLAGYFAIYIITPLSPALAPRYSLNRLFLQLWPSAIFLFFMVMRTPGWDKDVLCFIEVKTRTTHDVKPAQAAVDREKRRAIRVVIRDYLRLLPVRAFPDPPQWRFDVVTVYYERRPVNPTIELFQNALLSS
jgi:Holliday junction resolvase-like predicted endonuclease